MSCNSVHVSNSHLAVQIHLMVATSASISPNIRDSSELNGYTRMMMMIHRVSRFGSVETVEVNILTEYVTNVWKSFRQIAQQLFDMWTYTKRTAVEWLKNRERKWVEKITDPIDLNAPRSNIFFCMHTHTHTHPHGWCFVVEVYYDCTAVFLSSPFRRRLLLFLYFNFIECNMLGFVFDCLVVWLLFSFSGTFQCVRVLSVNSIKLVCVSARVYNNLSLFSFLFFNRTLSHLPRHISHMIYHFNETNVI